MSKEQKSRVIFWGACAVIGVLAVVTRLFRLPALPYGFHLDETSVIYNAWCLANYGVDRYLKSFPVYFINNELGNSGQSALYTYALAAVFKILGYRSAYARIPGVIFSWINIGFGMLTANRIFKEKKQYVLITGLLLTICPYFIMASRIALDCNLMLGMSTVFLYVMVCIFEEGRTRDYVCAGVAGGLVLYAYALSYAIMPVFLVLFYVALIRTKRFAWRKMFAMAVPMGLLALPLMVTQIINLFDLNEVVVCGVTLTKLTGYRLNNMTPFDRYKIYDISRCLFVGDGLPFNAIPGIPLLYHVSIVLGTVAVIWSLILCVRNFVKNRMTASDIMILWFASCITLFLRLNANVYRMNEIYFSYILMIVLLIRRLSGLKQKVWRYVPYVCVVIYLVSFGIFAKTYYGGEYTRRFYDMPYFDIIPTEGIRFLEDHPEYRHRRAYMAEWRLNYALATLTSPYEMGWKDDGNNEEFSTYYEVGTLPEIELDCDYIVRDIYTEYMEELSALGYREEKFVNHSVFYRVDE